MKQLTVTNSFQFLVEKKNTSVCIDDKLEKTKKLVLSLNRE